MILRRGILMAFVGAAACVAAAPGSVLRGRLKQQPGNPPSLETPDHRSVSLTGDDATNKVLEDSRIGGMELEVRGRFTDPSRFAVDRIETHSLVAIQGGKRYQVTYFCDVCAIRSFAPGLCVCCQQETRLDLIEAGQE